MKTASGQSALLQAIIPNTFPKTHLPVKKFIQEKTLRMKGFLTQINILIISEKTFNKQPRIKFIELKKNLSINSFQKDRFLLMITNKDYF